MLSRPPAWSSSTRMEADQAFAFGNRSDKNVDGLDSNDNSSATDMRLGNNKFGNQKSQKRAQRIRPVATGGETVLVTDRDRVVAERGPAAPGRSPLVSDALLRDPFARGGSGHRSRLEGQCRHVVTT